MEWERPKEATAEPVPSEQLIRQWMAEGLKDAEIAVRLRLSNAEVKERIERMRWSQGAAAAEASGEPLTAALESDASEERSISRRSAVVAAIVLLAFLVAAGVWAASSKRDRERDADPDFSEVLRGFDPDLYDAALQNSVIIRLSATPTQVPALPAVLVVRDGQAFTDLGEAFVLPEPSLSSLSITPDEGRVTVGFPAAGLFRLETGVLTWEVQHHSPPVLRGALRTSSYRMHIEPANLATRFIFGDDDTFAFYAEDGERPVLQIWVEGYDVEVGEDGHLYIALTPSD